MSLDVLLVESVAHVGREQADDLVRAGHRVHRCWADRSTDDATHGSLCVGVTERRCPLDRGVDVALLVRDTPTAPRTARESGATCAVLANVPLVAVAVEGMPAYAPWIAREVGPHEVTDACEVVVAHARDASRAALREQQVADLRSDPYVWIHVCPRGSEGPQIEGRTDAG